MSSPRQTARHARQIGEEAFLRAQQVAGSADEVVALANVSTNSVPPILGPALTVGQQTNLTLIQSGRVRISAFLGCTDGTHGEAVTYQLLVDGVVQKQVTLESGATLGDSGLGIDVYYPPLTSPALSLAAHTFEFTATAAHNLTIPSANNVEITVQEQPKPV